MGRKNEEVSAVQLRDFLADLREGEDSDDAELFLRDVARVTGMVVRGEADVLNGHGDEDHHDNDDETNDRQMQTENFRRRAALAIAAYQPQLTQPLWDHRVGKDGHLIILGGTQEKRIVVTDGMHAGDGAVADGDDVRWWLTTVYYYFSLSLLGVLVLAYSFVFTSIALDQLF